MYPGRPRLRETPVSPGRAPGDPFIVGLALPHKDTPHGEVSSSRWEGAVADGRDPTRAAPTPLTARRPVLPLCPAGLAGPEPGEEGERRPPSLTRRQARPPGTGLTRPGPHPPLRPPSRGTGASPAPPNACGVGWAPGGLEREALRPVSADETRAPQSRLRKAPPLLCVPTRSPAIILINLEKYR